MPTAMPIIRATVTVAEAAPKAARPAASTAAVDRGVTVSPKPMPKTAARRPRRRSSERPGSTSTSRPGRRRSTRQADERQQPQRDHAGPGSPTRARRWPSPRRSPRGRRAARPGRRTGPDRRRPPRRRSPSPSRSRSGARSAPRTRRRGRRRGAGPGTGRGRRRPCQIGQRARRRRPPPISAADRDVRRHAEDLVRVADQRGPGQDRGQGDGEERRAPTRSSRAGWRRRVPARAGGPGDDEGADPDRDVDVEDPAPGRGDDGRRAGRRRRPCWPARSRDGPSRGRPRRRTGPAAMPRNVSAPMTPERPRPGVALEEVRGGGGGDRDDGAAADGLDQPRGDELVEALGEAGQQRAEREDRQGAPGRAGGRPTGRSAGRPAASSRRRPAGSR